MAQGDDRVVMTKSRKERRGGGSHVRMALFLDECLQCEPILFDGFDVAPVVVGTALVGQYVDDVVE